MYEDVENIIALMPNQRNNVKILAFKSQIFSVRKAKAIYGTFTNPLRIA
jgi:hypothetical protein